MDKLTALLNASRMFQRFVAISLFLVGCAVIFAIASLTLNSLTKEAQNMTKKRIQLGNLLSVAALKKGIDQQNSGSFDGGAGPEFLTGSSEAVIRASLQSRLSAIAAAHGVNVLSVGNMPISQRGTVRYAGLRADFYSTNEAIHATLFDIETSKPYLVIRNASIRSGEITTAGKNAGQQQIVVQIQFYGALPPDNPQLGIIKETGR